MGYGNQQGLRATHDEKDVSKADHTGETDCWNELLLGSYRTLQRAAGIAAFLSMLFAGLSRSMCKCPGILLSLASHDLRLSHKDFWVAQSLPNARGEPPRHGRTAAWVKAPIGAVGSTAWLGPSGRGDALLASCFACGVIME